MLPGATGYVGMPAAAGFEGALAGSFVFADQEVAAVDFERAWGNTRTGFGNRWNSQSSWNRRRAVTIWSITTREIYSIEQWKRPTSRRSGPASSWRTIALDRRPSGRRRRDTSCR